MSHYDVIEGPEHVPIKAWTRGVPIEDAALKQLKNVASAPLSATGLTGAKSISGLDSDSSTPTF